MHSRLSEDRASLLSAWPRSIQNDGAAMVFCNCAFSDPPFVADFAVTVNEFVNDGWWVAVTFNIPVDKAGRVAILLQIKPIQVLIAVAAE